MKIKLKIEKEFDAKYLKVEAGVRYWEDADVNGKSDTENGDNIPCVNEKRDWCPLIEIDTGRIINWEIGKTANVHYKVCDDGKYTLLDQNKYEIKSIEGYVISDLAIGERGFGDYIIMNIDENGIIKNWNPTLKDFETEEY